MFGIGSTELIVILIVALLVLGPKNLPKIAQTLGRAMGEFRKVSTEFQRTLNTEIAFEEEADKHKAKKIAEQKEVTPDSEPATASSVAASSPASSSDTTGTTGTTGTVSADTSPSSSSKEKA